MDRRVPQTLLIYLAAAWTILQFTDWMVNRYALSSHLTDLCLTVLLAMIPSILIVAYFHGLPGRNQWHRIELFSVPVNILVVLALVYFLFAGKELGSTQRKIQVNDETGAVVEKVVVKSQFRKKVAIFFFENRMAKTENDWLKYAIPTMLEIDFSQDLYVEPLSPSSQNMMGNFFVMNKIKDAGFDDAVGLPLMLMKKIAGETNRDFFVCGGVTGDAASCHIDYVLYRTSDMKQMAKESIEGELFDTVDRMAKNLKQGMDIPSGQLDQVVDLPIGEIFTRSIPAAKSFTAGITEMVLKKDWAKAQSHFEQAVREDPAFAYANLQLAGLYAQSSQSSQWQAVIKTLMQQLYRLPERQQSFIKFDYYVAQKQPEKAMAMLDMMAGLYPEDTQVFLLRAQMRIARNQLDLALADYMKIQELDPQNRENMKSIASIHEMKGDFIHAEESLKMYSALSPGDADALLSLGQIKAKQGDHRKAGEYFQQAQLLRPDDVGTMIELGGNAFDTGNFDECLKLYKQAETTASTAEDRYKVFSALESYYARRGQLKQALDAFDHKIAEHYRFSVPMMSMIEESDRAKLLVLNGRSGEAYEGLDALQKKMAPPFNQYVSLGAIGALLEEKRTEEAERRLDDIRGLINDLGAEGLNLFILKAQARIAEIRGDYGRAVGLYLEVKQKSPRITSARNLAFCYRSLKKYEEADIILRQALSISPYDPELNFEAAELYWETGRKEQAIDFLHRAAFIWQNADEKYEPARRVRERLQDWST